MKQERCLKKWENRGSKICHAEAQTPYDECDYYGYVNCTNKINKN